MPATAGAGGNRVQASAGDKHHAHVAGRAFAAASVATVASPRSPRLRDEQLAQERSHFRDVKPVEVHRHSAGGCGGRL